MVFMHGPAPADCSVATERCVGREATSLTTYSSIILLLLAVVDKKQLEVKDLTIFRFENLTPSDDQIKKIRSDFAGLDCINKQMLSFFGIGKSKSDARNGTA